MLELEIRENIYTLIDDKDIDLVTKSHWNLSGNGYVVRHAKKDNKYTKVYLHREILNPDNGVYVDHINGNPLDNRRQNLRLCNKSQNNINRGKRGGTSSIYKGVSLDTTRQKWVAKLKLPNKQVYIGRFENERHAAMAWDIWAREFHGEFFKSNFNY